MTDLPASIEAALLEAGFSGSEVIVLKKLLQEDALTLRELAVKTGKSTGVLDQAVKKLLKKGILSRDVINDSPKYTLRSLEVVLKWMDDDTKSKQDMMTRRQQNFETFIRSITVVQNGNRRPEMEYFEGREGMKKAYMQLLNRGNDIVQYGPTLMLTEDDPLRDFKVQWFRERQRRGIFTRVITNDTVLGRRFQSRDPFEYRKTILVAPDAYPFMFEKMIVGETVACFQTEPDRAVFVRYPELAESERVFFERLWNKKIQKAPEPAADYDESAPPKPPLDVITIPFATKTLSSLREFFLSKKSIALLAGFGVLSAALTYGLYRRDVAFNTKRVQERALSIAATGALQFDSDDLQQIRSIADISKPEYPKIVYQLNQIRNQNEGVKHAYLMRPTGNADMLEFIADADGMNPYTSGDTNRDGIVDPSDDIPKPGEPYDIRSYVYMKELFVTGRPSVDAHPETDKWGTFLSGYGPIKDDAGRVVALFGVDIDAGVVHYLSANTYFLLGIFFGLFLLFVLVRLMAFNRSLFGEVVELMKPRRNSLLLLGGFLLSMALSVGLYLNKIQVEIAQLREQVIGIATTGALQFKVEDLEQLRTIKDMEKPEYEKVVGQLNRIFESFDNVEGAYLMRPTGAPSMFEFIADGLAIDLDIFDLNDMNKNGVYDEADELVYPGLPYDASYVDILKSGAYFSPIVESRPTTDKWGTTLSAYAPIKKSNGEVAALLGIDLEARGIYGPSFFIFAPVIAYGVIVLLLFLCWSPGIRSSLFYEIAKKGMNRKTLTTVGLILVTAYWLVFGLYSYTDRILREQAGRRLMAIAATAVLQINPDDLENLRFARDMDSPEYQRVFNTLNDIRNRNPEIRYAYILRPTETDGMWEFVADADSNAYLPFHEWDFNGDGILDDADANSPPGLRYTLEFSSPYLYREGLLNPTFERGETIDQWGVFITGSAPIRGKNGEAIAILALDIEQY